MIARLWDIIVGQFCWHQWEIISTADLVASENAMPHAARYDLRCAKCGNIKSKRTGGCAPW